MPSSGPCAPTAAGSGRVAPAMSVLAALLPLAVEDAATEGKKVITAMLIVGLCSWA